MAISAPHYRLFKSLKPILPRGGTLLEIGEANWYGELEPEFPCRDRSNWFTIAKDFYAATFEPSRTVAIDLNGSLDALRLDLNGSIDLGEQFGLVINHGTAEHIFNIGQVFKTMHDHCVDGGLMIHESPCTGWLDHGFYTLQPTLFYDLAAANCYEVVQVSLLSIEADVTIRLESREHVHQLNGALPKNANLYVVYRKLGDMPFRVPIQGYYAQTLSEAGRKAWENR